MADTPMTATEYGLAAVTQQGSVSPKPLGANSTHRQNIGGGCFSFITDPPQLRTARKDAALARLAWQQASKAHMASERLHRRYVLAKARLIGLEGER